MTFVRGLRQAEARLGRLDITRAITGALGEAAQALEAKVIETLSQSPGHDHSVPWLRTGSLRTSIGHTVDGTTAVIGSSSDVAVDQELGTHTVPPRPFLGSTAATTADDVAASVAVTVGRHLANG